MPTKGWRWRNWGIPPLFTAKSMRKILKSNVAGNNNNNNNKRVI